MCRALAVLACVLATTPGCLVVSLNRFFEDDAIATDDRLPGQWTSDDDNLSLTIERSEWRSYRITYTHPLETRSLTAYLFKVEGVTYLDVTPIRGEDQGLFVLPAHAALRVSIGADTIAVRPLNFDWFAAALKDRRLPAALGAERAERDQIVLVATPRIFAAWLAARADADPAWGVETVFKKKAGVTGSIRR
jgi:hypothetical protein